MPSTVTPTVSSWPSVVRWTAAVVLGFAYGTGLGVAASTLLPAVGAVAFGVRMAGVPVAPGQAARSAADAATAHALGYRVTFTVGEEAVVEASLAELGGYVDTVGIASDADAVGRQGGIFQRIAAALEARRGAVDIPVHVRLPIEPLASRLLRLKEERDTRPVAARYDVVHRTASPHEPGKYLDLYAALDRVEAARRTGITRIPIPSFEVVPPASTAAVTAIQAEAVLARFETRFGVAGNQVGRARNIRRAAARMDGVVLMPGDVVSFNDHVGPRSLDNGFFEAPEIYKGELREGIGGGTCQAAGTLHAAAVMGGVDIVERSNHSRPSGYIRMGLDATVVYPTVDLKLRNPYAFPVVIHSAVEQGTRSDQGTLSFELRGARHEVTVTFETATVGTADFKRRVDEVPSVPEGKAVLKQHGIRGYSIKKTRILHREGSRDRVEVATDTYPPTVEVYQVAPGTDVETLLPPLVDGRSAANDTAGN